MAFTFANNTTESRPIIEISSLNKTINNFSTVHPKSICSTYRSTGKACRKELNNSNDNTEHSLWGHFLKKKKLVPNGDFEAETTFWITDWGSSVNSCPWNEFPVFQFELLTFLREAAPIELIWKEIAWTVEKLFMFSFKLEFPIGDRISGCFGENEPLECLRNR